MLMPRFESPGERLVLVAEAREAARSGNAARIRRAAGLSQAEFATAIGVSGAALSLWEAGRRRPTGSRAIAYARALRDLAGMVDGAPAFSPLFTNELPPGPKEVNSPTPGGCPESNWPRATPPRPNL